MKTYDLATGAAIAFLFAIVAQGQHTPDLALSDCETVAVTSDNGQVLYNVLVDAECGAQFENEDVVLPEPEEEDEEAA